MESHSSSSPPLQGSRVTLRFPFLVNPSKTYKSAALSIFFLLLFFCNFSSGASKLSDSLFESLYIRLCNHIVPFSEVQPRAGFVPGISQSLGFQSGYFSGGDRLFNRTPQSAVDYLKYPLFRPQAIQKTADDGVYEVRALLHLRQRKVQGSSRKLRQIVYRAPRVSRWKGGVSFGLHGLWSESSGKLCMVGSDLYGNVYDSNVILKLNYPKNSSIFYSLISGTLQSFDDQNNLHYFEPISILALSQSLDYKYTLAGKDKEKGCLDGSDGGSLTLNGYRQGACAVLYGYTDRFELEYGTHCHSVSCHSLASDVGNLPGFMYVYGTRCAETRKVQMLLGFPNSSYHDSGFPFYPNTTLISEGT